MEEKRNKISSISPLILFVVQCAVYGAVVIGLVIAMNASVDASSVISAKSHTSMARIAMSGNIVATGGNYNERVYQVAIVKEMATLPKTLVVGSSRGMNLGEEITGYEDIYNTCVSGACMQDYYALIGLYYEKFQKIPERIIFEVSPWVFYENNPESRWSENNGYREAAYGFYRTVNGVDMDVSTMNRENPYMSMAYFQYNRDTLKDIGVEAFEEKAARISENEDEAADYPDGVLRYAANLENPSEDRLAGVRANTGGVTYQDVDKMTELSEELRTDFEALISFCQANGAEIILYLEPFSITKCRYIYDEDQNPVFQEVEDYLHGFEERFGVKVIGGYDARLLDLTDEQFVDHMHLDKAGVRKVWNETNE